MDDESHDDPRQRTTAVPARRVLQAGLHPRAVLKVVLPSELARTIELAGNSVVLGRQSESGGLPPLLHEAVSRRHFSVEWDAARGVHTGVDLGSSNGSFVDGQPASAPLPIRDGSVVRLGPSVVLVCEAGPQVPGDEASRVSREALPGDAAATRLLRSKLGKIAADPSPVLLVGETGTGKELLAAEIHRLSGRAGKLVAVNCAALSAHLVESQLFGHVRGAFTGAHDAQPGLFREADGGTLFLDEIGELPAELQPKLLRAIQEREIRAVGATRAVRVDVRIVAATNRDLGAEVERGAFRRDLYARLSLWELAVPAVRARRADLLMWIQRLHARWLGERGRADAPPLTLDAPAAEALLLAPWPDNLRGLDRLVHTLAAEAAGAGPVTLERLPDWVRARLPAAAAGGGEDDDEDGDGDGGGGGGGGGQPVVKLPTPTREELAAVLARLDGSIRATARHFGRDRRQIYRWLDAYGLKGR